MQWKVFQSIKIDPLPELKAKTRNLDFYQKKVVSIGIKFARDVVKALKNKMSNGKIGAKMYR